MDPQGALTREGLRFPTSPSHRNHMIFISIISLAFLTKYGKRELVAKRIATLAENTKNPQ